MVAESERFMKAVAENEGEWSALDVRAIAIRGEDRLWHLRALRVVLVPKKPRRRISGPKTKDFWTAHEVRPLKDLARLVNGISEGKLSIAGKNLVVKQDQKSSVSMIFQTAIHDSRYSAHKELPSSAYVLGTKSGHHFGIDNWRAERLETELAGLDPPWESYHDVVVNFLEEKQFDARLYDVAFHFVAPIGATLGPVQYDGLKLSGMIQGTSKTNQAKIRLAVLEHGVDGAVHRVQIALERGPRHKWKFTHLLRPETVRTVAMLNYRGLRAGYWTRLVPKASSAGWARAVEHFLPGKDILQDGLLNPDVRGQQLEPWAALLFSRLGFQTIMLGKFPGDLPDLVAEGPDEQILLIECTEDSPDVNDKLGKLSQRALRLESALGLDVQAVLLTRAAMDTIPETHRTKAREEDIALVAREQLLELGERTVQAVDPRETVAFLSSCIPIELAARGWGRRHRGIAGLL